MIGQTQRRNDTFNVILPDWSLLSSHRSFQNRWTRHYQILPLLQIDLHCEALNCTPERPTFESKLRGHRNFNFYIPTKVAVTAGKRPRVIGEEVMAGLMVHWRASPSNVQGVTSKRQRGGRKRCSRQAQDHALHKSAPHGQLQYKHAPYDASVVATASFNTKT